MFSHFLSHTRALAPAVSPSLTHTHSNAVLFISNPRAFTKAWSFLPRARKLALASFLRSFSYLRTIKGPFLSSRSGRGLRAPRRLTQALLLFQLSGPPRGVLKWEFAPYGYLRSCDSYCEAVPSWTKPPPRPEGKRLVNVADQLLAPPVVRCCTGGSVLD
jgi:hypothetical protein